MQQGEALLSCPAPNVQRSLTPTSPPSKEDLSVPSKKHLLQEGVPDFSSPVAFFPLSLTPGAVGIYPLNAGARISGSRNFQT